MTLKYLKTRNWANIRTFRVHGQQESLHSTFHRKALPGGLQYRYMELILGAVIAILSIFHGAVFRPYLTGYAAKKGENLATHEDIDKLVDQVKAITEDTKNIEAEISSGVWNKQKRWEMKR